MSEEKQKSGWNSTNISLSEFKYIFVSEFENIFVSELKRYISVKLSVREGGGHRALEQGVRRTISYSILNIASFSFQG